MPKRNALETYRRINRIKLAVSVTIVIVLVLVSLYYFLAARP